MKYGGIHGGPPLISMGQLRRNQIITTFGPGAIVNTPGTSVIVMGLDDWADESEYRIKEKNLQRLLRKKYFVLPKAMPHNNNEHYKDIPVMRFPTQYICQHCGRILPWWEFMNQDKKELHCNYCGPNAAIYPSRFVIACVNGHLDDFPFNFWVHQGHPCTKKDGYPDLRIYSSSKSGGLEGIIIECKDCGAKRSMAGCMNKNALHGYHCHGKKRWERGSRPDDCNASVRVLQRNASNLYFPITISALTLPEAENKFVEMMYDKQDILKKLSRYGDDVIKDVLKVIFNIELENEEVTLEDLFNLFLYKVKPSFENNEDSDFSENDLYEKEYSYLCKGSAESKLYKAIETRVPDFLKPYIEKIVLISRLREVLVLRGFRRIYPEYPESKEDANEDFKGWNGKPYISLSEKTLSWLPAIQMLGEGIFLKLNEDSLNEWEKKIEMRYRPLLDKADALINCKDKASTRYILLHTLSHLLIRQLSLDCGYSGAALKERIYSTVNSSGLPMAGILLYTSSTDSDGSLGGLVRMGRPENFEEIIRKMLQEASWCSSDPICIDSLGQGYGGLNYAACHACTLLPETSCELRNCLLDRAAVIGTLAHRELGYLSKLIWEK